jgi:two-component system, LytTR family, sensor kinase
VSEELSAAQDYLAIERLRFQDKLITTIDIEPAVNNYCMLSFLLQPLLENAIKYGLKTSSMPLRIELSARLKDNNLCFVIANTGHWLQIADDNVIKTDSLGVGLQNIRQRLRQHYPGRHNFTINDSAGRVEVKLEIPVLTGC